VRSLVVALVVFVAVGACMTSASTTSTSIVHAGSDPRQEVDTSTAEKLEVGCDLFTRDVLLEHNNIVTDATCVVVDTATRYFVLDSTEQACLDNPDAVELMRSEGVQISP
jgi:hypothetical protein